jgi:zinc/manganese transport system substrate-binding protein
LRGQNFITYHDNWLYLADRLGIVIPIQIENLPGIPPSARHRDLVIRTAKDGGARAIICAAYYATKSAEFVAEQSGRPLLVLPMDAGADPRAEDYFALIDLLIGELARVTG